MPEQLEEALQGGGVATGGAPHDRAAGVVNDAGQVALAAAIADLIAADHHQPLQPSLVEVIGDHARDDPRQALISHVFEVGPELLCDDLPTRVNRLLRSSGA